MAFTLAKRKRRTPVPRPFRKGQAHRASYSVAPSPEYGRRTSPRKESQDSHQAVVMNVFQIMGDRSAVCWRRQSCNCKELDWVMDLACEWEFAGVKDGLENHAS